MKQQKKFEIRQDQELTAQHQAAHNAGREFSSVDELLRHDAAGINAPASIAERLQKSSAEIPRPNRSWWQRLFGQ